MFHSERADSMGGAIEAGRATRSAAAAVMAVVAVLLGVLALHLQTLRSMADVWAGSGTYTHGFAVIPTVLWLIWRRRAELVAAPLRHAPLALVATSILGFVWLLGDLSASQSVSHFALILTSISAVVAVFGLAWARALAFPLLLLLFAVPFGAAFVPALMDWTADFTVAALRLSGVPVLREGNDLTIPTGRWSVVEACSGARYLLASLLAGTVFAWVFYRSPVQRALLVAASIAVPIVANWLRAYLIVMLGHLSSNQFATGVDHLIYGWIFFGVIIFALFASGLRWREDDLAPRVPRGHVATGNRWRISGPVVLGALVSVGIWPALAGALAERGDVRAVQPVPVAAQSGWTEHGPELDWKPQIERPRAALAQSFERAGRSVTVHVGFFRNQDQRSELVNSQHRLDSGEAEGWRPVDRGRVTAPTVNGAAVDWTLLRGPRGQQLRIWHWYWLGETVTTSGMRAKLDLAVDRLLLRSDTSAWVMLATVHDTEHPERSAATLAEFVQTMGFALDAALRATAAR